MNANMKSPVTLIDDDTVKVTAVASVSGAAVLCFSGIGHQLGGIDVQTHEFFRASQDATAIFITDKTRSWGNKLDFPEIARTVAPFIANRTVYAIGNSMGGFLAILATRFFDIASVVAFCPQFSVRRTVVDEDRWNKYVDSITEWKYPSLEGAFNNSTAYYVFGSATGKDAKHIAKIPAAGNVHKIVFRARPMEHREAKALKDDGILYSIIDDCFRGVSPDRIIGTWLAGPRHNAYWQR